MSTGLKHNMIVMEAEVQMATQAQNDKQLEYNPVTLSDLLANPPKPPEWLVGQLFPVGSLNVIGGDSGIGKSWMTLYLALCVASGKAFLGQLPVKQGKVLLIDEEDAMTLIHDRLKRLMKGMGLEEKSLPVSFLISKGILVDRPESYEALMNTVREQNPDLIVIDSLVRVHGADENATHEISKVLTQIRRMTEVYQRTVIMTHHTRKWSRYHSTPAALLRGSTDIRAIIDSHLFMKKAKGNLVLLLHDKSRWGPTLEPMGITMEHTEDDTCIHPVPVQTVKSQSKVEQCKEAILELLKDGEKATRQRVLAYCKNNLFGDFGQNTVDAALKELVAEQVVQSQGCQGKTKTYWMEGPEP